MRSNLECRHQLSIDRLCNRYHQGQLNLAMKLNRIQARRGIEDSNFPEIDGKTIATFALDKLLIWTFLIHWIQSFYQVSLPGYKILGTLKALYGYDKNHLEPGTYLRAVIWRYSILSSDELYFYSPLIIATSSIKKVQSSIYIYIDIDIFFFLSGVQSRGNFFFLIYDFLFIWIIFFSLEQ